MTPLSARLETVLLLVRPCGVLADVGTDHGFIPVAAVQRGLAQRAIAADLRAAPLLGARRHIERALETSRVTVVHGDGLLALAAHAVDAVVMAGLSGRLMVRLSEAAPQVLGRVQQLIVQPNQDVPLVRAWALRHRWHLQDERMIYEHGRFFTICAFVKGSDADPAYAIPGWTPAALCQIGPRLLLRKDPVARRWCEAQHARLRHWVNKGVTTLAPELEGWQAACDFMR